METDILWQTKLAARLHDPAEKALVLLRDPAGHENGTSRALRRLMGFQDIQTESVEPDNGQALAQTVLKGGIPKSMYRHIQRADWWAAAADRPQWPMEEITVPTTSGGTRTFKVAPWAQVHWTRQPVLIHPLTGESYDLGKKGGLQDTDFHDIKERSLEHHARLIGLVKNQDDDRLDWKKALLVLWRFAPELLEEDDNGKLGSLWNLLPADTRLPDHSIWEHLDLASAFAGAFAADPKGEPALLSLSIGPVQPFIAAARKAEDLWAGSHLLARLSWEAMRIVCDQLGPDAILFPRLRGIPQVDLWLRDQCGLPAELFTRCDWNHGRTDSNPLFVAATPNRFVAIVPAAQARALAEAIQRHVRGWLQAMGKDVLGRLLKAAQIEDQPDLYCHQQMHDQLDKFPEVHWAVVPFSLIRAKNTERQTDLDITELSAAMRPFFDAPDGKPCGFLATPAWQLLQKELILSEDNERSVFFAPNPGVLYPAIHDLSERLLSAAKSVRPFTQHPQTGWRDTLSGETEWLTDDALLLDIPPGKRTRRRAEHASTPAHHETLWMRIADQKPAWAKPGEHLGALSAIKRLWPTLFAEEVAAAIHQPAIGRFAISSHTMALAHQLDQWLEHGAPARSRLDDLLQRYPGLGPVALPRKLVRDHMKIESEAVKMASLMPALLDLADDEAAPDAAPANTVRRAVRQVLNTRSTQPQVSAETSGDASLETYYALLKMDGDHMGAWLSGGEEYAISYLQSLHPTVRAGFEKHAARQPDIAAYGKQKRALSPNRHMAISAALNDFSLRVARHVIEEEHLGRLIYAGGDDVLAMLPVADLLSAMQRLRNAYSGHDPEHEGGRDPAGLTLHKGFALLHNRLMRMMGTAATASCGAVIAHHQAPLSAVRRELDLAERRAKTEGKRDAFSITIIKRSGGALHLTDQWGEPLAALQALRSFLSQPNVSRRAAYHTLQWLNPQELPDPEGQADMLQSLLAYQFAQQSGGSPQAQPLACRLIDQACRQPTDQRINWLRNFIAVAEFMARETRNVAPRNESPRKAA
ncbi:MAG: type III-B CRISPR-associated protein Cas10/Cmr2 [Burkholderiaceae bacterium]